MPVMDKSCNVYQGYNFKKDMMTTVGYITSLKIGDKECKADQKCSDPESPDSSKEVVAVLKHFNWGTGVTDGMSFDGQISTENQQQVKTMVLKDLAKVGVSFSFAVFEYDPVKKAYFKCASGESLKGLIEKNGDSLSLHVDDDAGHEVQSPQNFGFSAGIKPEPESQDVPVAASTTQKLVKKWGSPG